MKIPAPATRCALDPRPTPAASVLRAAVLVCGLGLPAAAIAVAGQVPQGGIVLSARALAESASGRPQPNECAVMVGLMNHQPQAIDSLTIDLSVYIKGSARPEIRSVYFGHVPPPGERSTLMTMSHPCPAIARIVLQEASYCRLGGKRALDCLDRIEVRNTAPGHIPLQK